MDNQMFSFGLVLDVFKKYLSVRAQVPLLEKLVTILTLIPPCLSVPTSKCSAQSLALRRWTVVYHPPHLHARMNISQRPFIQICGPKRA